MGFIRRSLAKKIAGTELPNHDRESLYHDTCSENEHQKSASPVSWCLALYR